MLFPASNGRQPAGKRKTLLRCRAPSMSNGIATPTMYREQDGHPGTLPRPTWL